MKSDAKFKEKLICGFKYDMKNLVIFHPTEQKSKNFFSMGSFCPKYTSYKNTEELSFMTLNSDAKQWHIRWTFIRALKSMKNFTLMGSFCPKHIKFQMKKYRRVMSHDTIEWCKIWKKLALGSKNDLRKLVNFNASNSKSENLYFDVLLLSKIYYVWAKKVHRSYVSQHWRMMLNLKRNWFVL